MTKRTGTRYDPLYRAFDTPEELSVVEGKFRKLFERLEGIGNLGIIPEVLRMAKYSKYEHHIGTIHQLESLLRLAKDSVIPKRYRMSLKLAAMFLHVGHLPYTYSTERSLLLASSLGDPTEENETKQHVHKLISKVLKVTRIEEAEKDNIIEGIFSLRDYRRLYRFFSAVELINSWSTLRAKLTDLKDDDLEIAIRNLIGIHSDGYDFLELADRADYVQRDALYFGTIQLDISPRHLYGELSKYGPIFESSEAKLIETSLKYLSERFYKDPEVIWFSRLYEKIVAAIIIGANFDINWLSTYTDNEFKRLICTQFNRDNERVLLPATWVKRAHELFKGKIVFSEIFKLDGLAFQKARNVIDVEYLLIGKRPSMRGLLTYPYESGVLLSVEHSEGPEQFLRTTGNRYSVIAYHDESNKNLISVLNLIYRLSHHLSHSNVERVRIGLGKEFSWTNSVRFDNGNILDVIVSAIRSIERKSGYGQGGFIERYLSAITSIATYEEIWYTDYTVWRSLIPQYFKHTSDDAEGEELYKWFVDGLLSLPARLLQFQTTRTYLDEIYEQLQADLRSEIPSDRKGNVFEALWLIERLRTHNGKFQFFLNGLVVVDPDKARHKQDQNEFDVIELTINDDNKAECCIYACSISVNYREKNGEQLTKLVDHIHEVFPDATVRAFYVVPDRESWEPIRKDAGRSYIP